VGAGSPLENQRGKIYLLRRRKVVNLKGGTEMAMNLLRQIAGSRLPMPFYRKEDIDGVRVLRAAGLVVALIRPASTDGSLAEAQVLAITQKGREELAKFGYPESRALRWRFRMPRIRSAAFIASTRKSSTPREPTKPH
jgi:hypothetical protein